MSTPNSLIQTLLAEDNNSFLIANSDFWKISDIIDFSGNKTPYIGEPCKSLLLLHRDNTNQKWLGTTTYPSQTNALTRVVLTPNFSKLKPDITASEYTILDTWFRYYYQSIQKNHVSKKPNAYGVLKWIATSLTNLQGNTSITDNSIQSIGGTSLAKKDAIVLLLLLQNSIYQGLLGRFDIEVL